MPCARRRERPRCRRRAGLGRVLADLGDRVCRGRGAWRSSWPPIRARRSVVRRISCPMPPPSRPAETPSSSSPARRSEAPCSRSPGYCPSSWTSSRTRSPRSRSLLMRAKFQEEREHDRLATAVPAAGRSPLRLAPTVPPDRGLDLRAAQLRRPELLSPSSSSAPPRSGGQVGLLVAVFFAGILPGTALSPYIRRAYPSEPCSCSSSGRGSAVPPSSSGRGSTCSPCASCRPRSSSRPQTRSSMGTGSR